jgi:hypothetical protein
LLHSFAGDAFAACAAHLGLDHMAPERLDKAAHAQLKREREAEAIRRQQAALAFCERIWRGGVDIEGSPGERYLAARGIDWFPADLRYHPAAPRGYSTAATAPGILALARSLTGAPKAIQATFLAPDGRAKTHRITFGLLSGSAVRLAPAGSELAIAEGVETAASFSALEGLPTWATLGTSNLEVFQPPSCVRRLTIAADGDAAGLRSAQALAERLRQRCAVAIASAPTGADWNDVATGMVRV